MLRLELRHVKRQVRRHVRRDGTAWARTYYFYQRRHAPDDGARLPDDPQSPEFLAALRAFDARADGRKAALRADGSFAALALAYRAAPEFLGLAVKTQKDYGRILDRLGKRAGHLPVAGIDREVVYKIRDAYADKPRTANLTLAVLRLVLGWAVERGMLAANPAARPRQLRTAPRSAVWSIEAEAKFLELAPRAMRLAYMLAVYTAQRQGDILRLTWAQLAGGRLALRQGKTGAAVSIPVHSALAAALKATERRSPIVLTDDSGRPFKSDHFRHLWRAATLAAGLDGLEFRDLRRTAMVRLAEAGASPHEIAAISGHKIDQTQAILETYTPRTAAMASAGMKKLETKDRRARVRNKAAEK